MLVEFKQIKHIKMISVCIPLNSTTYKKLSEFSKFLGLLDEY